MSVTRLACASLASGSKTLELTKVAPYLFGAAIAFVVLLLVRFRSRSRSKSVLSAETAASREAADKNDPIAEAEFQMAYGLYDQAARTLLSALDQGDDRIELKMKVLEVYFVEGSAHKFETAANRFAPQLSGADEWVHVTMMAEQLDVRLGTGD